MSVDFNPGIPITRTVSAILTGYGLGMNLNQIMITIEISFSIWVDGEKQKSIAGH